MKVFNGLIGLFLFCACLSKSEDKKVLSSKKEKNLKTEIESNVIEIDYSSYIKEAQLFIKINNYNQDFFFLIDLGKHSGLKRFFVYDFKKNKIVKSHIMTHGWGYVL